MTTEQAEQTELRPFHETIVEAIRKADSIEEFILLTQLINQTKIPSNHDAIIAVWTIRAVCLGVPNLGIHDDVIIGLVAQKREAEAKASDEKKSVNLHDKKERALMIVIERIISIIQNWRQPSPQARDKVAEVFQLAEAAKRIHSAKDETDFQNAIVGL